MLLFIPIIRLLFTVVAEFIIPLLAYTLVSLYVGKMILLPFEIANVLPVKVKDWWSESVNVGRINEPPLLESVIVFPDCEIDWGLLLGIGKVIGVLPGFLKSLYSGSQIFSEIPGAIPAFQPHRDNKNISVDKLSRQTR